MKQKKTVIIAAAVIAGMAALLVPRTIHNAAASTASSKNFTVSIVATGGACSNEFCYSPANLTIRQADTVTWLNNTTTIHTVTICTTSACEGVGPGTGTDPAFNSGIIDMGATFPHEFHGAGTYHYYCQIHGYGVMHGTITVLPFIVKEASLPAGTVGSPYSLTLKAAGGESPEHWSVASGALPKGLKLSAETARISGTPTTSGTYTFTVKVTDSSTPVLTATRQLSILINK